MPRKICANLFMSLDGVVEAPETWSLDYWNDEIAGAMSGGMSRPGALLLGRRTFTDFAAYWPKQPDNPITDRLNASHKYVVSSTLSSADWNNSELISESPGDRIRELKSTDGGDIATSGSPTLVRWLMEQELLDELQLLVYPIALGSGAQLFTRLDSRHPLTLTSSETFSNGVLKLVYEPA